MNGQVHRIVTTSGFTLAASEFPAIGDARGVVVLGHATMCNRSTLDRPRGKGLASTLAMAGLHVYTFDFRGHGQSGATAGAGSQWTYDDLVNHDLPAVVAWARARHPDLRLGVLGHSLAGHAALHWLGQHPDAPVDALVLYAANVWVRSFEPSRLRWFKKRTLLALWLLVSRTVGHYPARIMRTGSDNEALGLVADCNRWAATGRCLRESDGADYLAGRARVRQPVLAYVGEKDGLLCVRECCERYLAPVPDHTLKSVPAATHMSLVLSHRSQPAWAETAKWFLEKLGKPA
jgi:predicted alpha/beta hydrolase